MRFPFSKALVSILAQVMIAGVGVGQVLTHGPVVGGVTASEARVFVRTDVVGSVELRYGTDPTFATYLTTPAVDTDPASDFTTIIPLADLTAETTYYLDVVVNAVPQLAAPYPSFATFPPSGSARNFKFICFSDFTNVQALRSVSQTFTSAAAENPAFVFIGGDFDHRNPKTLDDKRHMFQELYDPSTRFMNGFVDLILRRMAMMHQWDDHDSGANNLDKSYLDWSLNQQVYQEYLPSYPLPAVTPGIWQKFSYAQVDCFVLDCRSQRDHEDDPDDSNKSMLDGNNLGASGELQWLKDGLLASTARWKIIFTSVVTNPTTKFPDGWAGYQTEWNDLKDFINTNLIQGVVFISGDLHLGAIDNGTASGFPEMCISQANGMGGCPTSGYGIWSEGYYDDPTCKGYGVVAISSDPDQLIFETVDENGVVKISYTVTDGIPTPTPTPTPEPPVITVQPVDKSVRVGRRARFSVTATGTPPLLYQWQRNGANIGGATAPSFTTRPVTAADNGKIFAVIVTNDSGSVTSDNATLTVRP